jgi:hypothetical protein
MNSSNPDPEKLPLKREKLQRLADAAQRLAAAAVRRDFWVRTARALADHKPREEETEDKK